MEKHSLSKKLLVLYRTVIYSGCILLILSFILFSIGCESVDSTDVTSENASENGSSSSSETENTDSGEDISENGDSMDSEESKERTGDFSEDNGSSDEDQTQTEESGLILNIYYADEQGEYLIGESRKVSSENKYEEALYELMKLPVDSSLIRLIPDTTIINSVEVEDGMARVDLSDNFVEDRYQGDAADILLVYSVVNTLTEFPGVNSVTFYIDGKKLNILGSLDISAPIYRKNDLIKN